MITVFRNDSLNDLQKLKATFDEIGQKYEMETAQSFHGKNIIEDEGAYDHTKISWDTMLSIDEGVGRGDGRCAFFFVEGKLTGHSADGD